MPQTTSSAFGSIDDAPTQFQTPSSGVAPNGLPYFSWDQGALQLNREGWSWSATLGAPMTISYGFRASGAVPDFSGISGFSRFNATQIEVAEELLDLWSEVANITFVRSGDGYANSGSILFANFINGPPQFSAFAYLPEPGATAGNLVNGDVWVNVSRDYDANPRDLPLGAQILLHEIGHAIGLLHPSVYDGGAAGGATYAQDADFWQDTRQFTVMSYFSETNTGASYGQYYVTAPQMFDIAAAQYLYGPNMTTRTGDTVYGFNSNAGHDVFAISSAAEGAIFCIWDAGGVDTLDLSGYTTNSHIDLRAESFSSAGSHATGAMLGNISIARGVTIENAIGGAGDDTIIGNEDANTLSGLAGADTINGAGGDDIIYGHSEGATGEIVSTAVFTGIAQPVAASIAPGDPGFFYIVEKDTGIVLRANIATGQRTTFLDIPQNQFSNGGESGVLNVAFHPDYADNGRFFVFLTTADGNLQVREYQRSANPAVANTTFTTIIEIAHPTFSNHNGGWIEFSPVDGYLYIGVGDGGNGGDPPNNAQNLDSLLGKILRIDIDADGFPSDPARNYAIPANNPFVGIAGADEIWAYGLRNPWRASFDPRNGDIYIGDVGQGAREEIDYRAITAPAGANFGWRIMEGSLTYNPDGPPGTPAPGHPSLILPIFEYGRDVGTTVTGGIVYTGGVESFVGQYVFADFGSDRLFSLSVVNGAAIDPIDRTDQIVGPLPANVVSFAVDANGALYAIGIGGTIWRLDPVAGAEDIGDTLDGGAGADRVYAGAGADTLIGGDGDDVLDGGVGRDRIAGGDGDDEIVWDANDDLANISGGAGSDTLVFLQGAAPTSFNLGTHGFEGAQGRFTDTGGAEWTTRTEYYDVVWRLALSVIVNDDASRLELDYDETDAFDWLTNWNRFDPTGALDVNVLTLDDETQAVLDFDQAGAFSWLTSWTRYDANDAIDVSVVTNDDNSRVALDFDQDDDFAWSSDWSRYDSGGAQDVNVLTYDDGARAALDLDQTGAFDWQSNWTQTDALGRTDLNVLVYDDGRRAVLDYDQADAFEWATMWWLYDSGGGLIAHVTVNDDGSII